MITYDRLLKIRRKDPFIRHIFKNEQNIRKGRNNLGWVVSGNTNISTIVNLALEIELGER